MGFFYFFIFKSRILAEHKIPRHFSSATDASSAEDVSYFQVEE